jgi:hypothetical protein
VIGFIEELVEVKRTMIDKDFETYVSVQEAVLKLRKKIAKSVLKRGGNAVFTYRQSVDHEGGGETQDKIRVRILVVRAYGTAVLLQHRMNPQ